MTDHDRIEELIAAHALGGLDTDGEHELEVVRQGHGRECADCARLEADYQEVAGRLAFALDPLPVPDRMEDEVLARALDGDSAHERVHSPGWARRSLTAVAAAVLVIAGGVAGYVAAPRSGGDPAALSGYLAAPGTRLVQFGGSARGNLALAYHPGNPSAYVVGRGVNAPPAGRVYELWLMYGAGRNPVPAGTFTASGDLVVVHLRVDASSADRMAVTIERDPGTQQPTTSPVWTTPSLD